MHPEQFLQRLAQIVSAIKIPTLVIIFIIALVQVLIATFISGRDKRENFTTVIGLMAMAAVIFYVDQLVRWLSTLI